MMEVGYIINTSVKTTWHCILMIASHSTRIHLSGAGTRCLTGASCGWKLGVMEPGHGPRLRCLQPARRRERKCML